MFRELFSKQKQHIDYFFAQLDVSACDILLDKVLACQGVLYFTGIGKSGFIAQKIAATMLSTGTKAFFLPPVDALHGDLAMVSKSDLVLILSKSGETDELLSLLPFIRAKGAQILAITSCVSCRLSKASDHTVVLPCENELCPFDLAPTTSTEVQLLFGDALAMAVMKSKGFDRDQFAVNHPGGQIGRRSVLKVRDLMLDRDRTPLCLSHDQLAAILVDFSNKRCGCMIVIDDQRHLKGIFTDGDLRRALQAKGEQILQQKVGTLMTNGPKSISADALAWDALKLMESDQKHPVMVLPVVDESQAVIGIIKMHDLVQAGL